MEWHLGQEEKGQQALPYVCLTFPNLDIFLGHM